MKKKLQYDYCERWAHVHISGTEPIEHSSSSEDGVIEQEVLQVDIVTICRIRRLYIIDSFPVFWQAAAK